VKKTFTLFAWMMSALLVSGGILALIWAPRAYAGPRPLYPDLKTLKPFDLQFGTEIIDGETHQLLRFSNTVYNAGGGTLELMGLPVTVPGGQEKTRVYQMLYSASSKRPTSHAVGTFVYHPEHAHFHFGGFAKYQLWTRAKYDAWLRSGRTKGSPKRANRLSSKVTYCIMDYEPVDLRPRSPQAPFYSACDPLIQGMSVGWGDTYIWKLYDQWVDLGTVPMADGRYVLRSVADPDNRIYESKGKRNDARESGRANAAVTYFSVEGGVITVGG
jgi:hypothetical protein